MATLATQDIPMVSPGLTPSYAAATGGGDFFTPDSDTFLHVKNSDSSSHNVIVTTPGTYGGLQIGDPTIAVAAGTERMFGPFPAQLFADSTNSGLAAITYSSATGMTIAALRCRVPAGV